MFVSNPFYSYFVYKQSNLNIILELNIKYTCEIEFYFSLYVRYYILYLRNKRNTICDDKYKRAIGLVNKTWLSTRNGNVGIVRETIMFRRVNIGRSVERDII